MLDKVTLSDALKHPNWSMGRKITVDSATLMNKGLEVIEAMHLFDARPEDIEIVVHRESIIHSMVEFIDGSVIAQLGIPDMTIPIQYALTYPQRVSSEVPSPDFFKLGKLSFFPPDSDTFRCLGIALELCGSDSGRHTVMNSANEKAVELFLEEKISFRMIPEMIEYTLKELKTSEPKNAFDVLQIDRAARETAAAFRWR